MDKKEVLEKKIESTERLINDLQNELNGLKEQKDILDKEENKVWKPKQNKRYFCVEFNARPDTYHWRGDKFDEEAYEIGNCFKTEEEAKDMAFCTRLYSKLKKFAKENNDWEKNQEPYIYRIAYINDGTIFCDFSRKKYIGFGVVSFSSREICEKAIEKFKDDLHKYFQIKKSDRKINN